MKSPAFKHSQSVSDPDTVSDTTKLKRVNSLPPMPSDPPCHREVNVRNLATFSICNIGMSGLRDMYTQSRAPQAQC